MSSRSQLQGDYTYTGTNGATVIDYSVLSTRVVPFVKAMEVGNFLGSDHHPILLFLDLKTSCLLSLPFECLGQSSNCLYNIRWNPRLYSIVQSLQFTKEVSKYKSSIFCRFSILRSLKFLNQYIRRLKHREVVYLG